MTTPGDHPDAIETTVHRTYRWIRELSEELGDLSEQEAYRILRAFLHGLRDRLMVDETADLGAQLPMLLRGLYYEGWDPSRTPRRVRAEEFMQTFVREAAPQPWQRPEPALRAAAHLLRRHVAEGEMADVLQSLPDEIRRLLE